MKITFEKETKIVLEVEDAATVTFVETPESTAIMVNNHSDSWLKKMYHFLLFKRRFESCQPSQGAT